MRGKMMGIIWDLFAYIVKKIYGQIDPRLFPSLHCVVEQNERNVLQAIGDEK